MSESLSKKTLNGTIWSAIERFSVQGISFVVVLIMARILTPEDYGLVGLITIFISIAQSLIDSGFSQALIRKHDRSQIDNSTVFYFNITIGILIYILLYILSPLISHFYNEPSLELITKVISISVFFNSLSVVQRALLTVKLDFKTQTKASIIAVIIAGIVGIYLSYSNFGVWSIVWYQLINVGTNTLLLWFFAKWRPSLVYSWQSFNALFKVGFNLAISGIIDTLYNNLYLLVIGKLFKPTELGYYTRAQQFAFFPTSSIANIIQRVSYPTLCLINNTRGIHELQRSFISMLRLSCFVVFPVAIELASTATPVVSIVLNKQWIPAAPLLVPLCLALMWYPAHALNLNVILALGKSDKILRIEILKKITGIIILLITIPFGVSAMCYGSIIGAIISLYINSYYTGKLIQFGFIKQLKVLLPILFLSGLTGIVTNVAIHFIDNNYIKLIIGYLLGLIVFYGLSYVLSRDALNDLLKLIKNSKS